MKRHFLIKFLIVLLGIFSQFPLVRIVNSSVETGIQKFKQKELSNKVFSNNKNNSIFDCECNEEFDDDDGDDDHEISFSKFHVTPNDFDCGALIISSNQCASWTTFKIYLKNRNLRI